MLLIENEYENLIESLRFKKNSNILICIPTFKSYEITAETIKSFLSQKGVVIDIMITGPSGDIEKLAELFPQINYCLTKDNYGSSGNQLINIYISKKFKYEFVMLNDNDAKLVGDDSLNIMIQKIINENLYVTFPIPFGYSSTDNLEFCTFHCCLYRVEVFNLIDNYFLFDYFLIFDDTALLIKLKKYKNYIKQASVYMSHPEKPTVFFSYTRMFFFVRSYFSFMFYEKVSIWSKIYYLFLFKPYWSIPMYFLYSILNLDFKFFKIFFIALNQVIFKKYKLLSFENPKIKYEEVQDPENKELYKKFNLTTDVILPKKYIYFIDENLKKRFLKKI